jgi:flagellar motor switch protein FliM
METQNRNNPLIGQVDLGVLGLVQDLFRTAVRKMRIRLVNRAKMDIQVRFGSAEFNHLGHLQDRMVSQEGGIFVLFEMNPGGMQSVLIIEGSLWFRLLGLLLGEDSSAEPPLYRWRALTRVDLNVAQRIVSDVLSGLVETCPVNVEATTEILEISSNPRIPMSIPRGTTMVEVHLDFGPPDDPYGLMTLAIPAQIGSALWPREGVARAGREKNGMQRVLPLPVTLVGELARIRMPLSTVRQLQVGSVIDLGYLREIQLAVAGHPTMMADFGERDGYRCVRITRRINEELEQLPPVEVTEVPSLAIEDNSEETA